MPLFQHSVINRYIAGLSKPALDEAYTRFGRYFLDPQRQRNIRDAKEEQYQEGFLRELFVQVLGYTLNPDPGFNLTTEYRNVKDSRKADGAILSGDTVKAVIELKGTEVTDLGKVESQAFGYKNNQPGCRYVIISNFEKIRFYIDNAVDHIEFNLFTLTRREFDLLWLCLSHACLMQDLPARIKEESLSHETEITRALYRDYSLFKRELHQNLTELNPQFDPLTLFKKSQKLLSRLLFLFFAEDRNLLPPNSVRLVLGDWRDLKERDAEVPLYDRFKKYFGYLNTGFRGKRYDVFAYNGGLFKPDLVLDGVRIDDELLYRHTLKLSEYDFISEIDVNILGHIFENSLNELDEIRAQLEGTPVDKAKTKRKKEGVYYTPKYITKYIVENTVGRLCREKREELAIVDEDFTDAVRRQTKTRQALLDKLTAYRTWLLHLTICDPACGSGAFLNQALEFLIAEHHAVDELQSRLFGDAMVLSDLDKSILENNLYGVDLNEESVEIARLSLWLRTARPNRTLNDLSANIKVGNSLIDNPAVAGDKAFDWHKEFPHVFAKGGFDVVIGNPPYVNAIEIKRSLPNIEFEFLKSNYITAKGTVDLYIFFFEKGLKILRDNGHLSFITPNRYLSASYGRALREFIIERYRLESIINYSDKNVFQDASTYPVITFLKKSHSDDYSIFSGKVDTSSKSIVGDNFNSQQLKAIPEFIIGFLLNDKFEISEKIISTCISLSHVGKINATSTAKEADVYSSLISEKRKGLKIINTGTIDRYVHKWGHEPFTDKGRSFKFPVLDTESDIISCQRRHLYKSPKIVIAKIGLRCEAFYDKNGEFASINTNCIHSINENFLPEFVLCWINSRLFGYIFECLFDGLRMAGGYLLYSAPNLTTMPIKKVSLDDQLPFPVKANQMLSLNINLHSLTSSFHRTLQRHFGLEDIPAKLQRWYQMGYGEFVKELQKRKVKLTLAQEAEWEPYFLAEAVKAQELKRTIDATDREIDRMVYALYGLTEEEIAIVEGRESGL